MATAQKRTSAASASNGAQTPPAAQGGTVALAGGMGGALALPAAFMARLNAAAKDEAAKERPSLSKISLRGGLLSYQKNPVADNVLPVVILVATHRNTYYDKPFDPDNMSNPVCFSLGESDNDMVAHENVPDENVGPDSDENKRPLPRGCKGCALNDWGSDPKGGKGKACKETRRLVVLPASALDTPEDIMKAEMAILDIPVTSGANYSNFVNGLAASTGLPPWAAVTEISTVRDVKTQFKVTFTPVSVVGEEALFDALERRRTEAVRLALTPYDEVSSTKDGAMAEGKGVAAKAAPAKKAKF